MKVRWHHVGCDFTHAGASALLSSVWAPANWFGARSSMCSP